MEMSTESIHHRWYESPRVNTTTSPVGQSSSGLGSGQLDGTSGVQGSSNGSSDLNPAVAEHMGAFFLDPSSSHHQRAAAARYYHQSMHSPYAAAASHGKFHPQIIFFFPNLPSLYNNSSNHLQSRVFCENRPSFYIVPLERTSRGFCKSRITKIYSGRSRFGL